MNKTVIFILVTSISVFASACSSANSSNTSDSNSTNPTLTINPPTNADNPTLNANMVPIQNAENTKEVAPGIPVPVNSNVQVIKPDMSKTAKPTELKVQAPDNSEISSRLDEKGAVSVRVFKNHPTVARVEQIMSSSEDQKITVFLKNGQSKTIPFNKDVNVMMISGDEIAKLAGVAPKSAPAASPQTKEEIKKAEEAEKASGTTKGEANKP